MAVTLLNAFMAWSICPVCAAAPPRIFQIMISLGYILVRACACSTTAANLPWLYRTMSLLIVSWGGLCVELSSLGLFKAFNPFCARPFLGKAWRTVWYNFCASSVSPFLAYDFAFERVWSTNSFAIVQLVRLLVNHIKSWDSPNWLRLLSR